MATITMRNVVRMLNLPLRWTWTICACARRHFVSRPLRPENTIKNNNLQYFTTKKSVNDNNTLSLYPVYFFICINNSFLHLCLNAVFCLLKPKFDLSFFYIYRYLSEWFFRSNRHIVCHWFSSQATKYLIAIVCTSSNSEWPWRDAPARTGTAVQPSSPYGSPVSLLRAARCTMRDNLIDRVAVSLPWKYTEASREYTSAYSSGRLEDWSA